MKADELLLWLSARREGSWRQFRAAVEELHSKGTGSCAEDDQFPLHQHLRLDFQRLAHVEFFARGCENGWRVTPPTLAAHPVSGGVRGVLCGARSPALLDRVLCAVERFGGETHNAPGVPAVIRLVAPDTQTLAAVASSIGVRFQTDAPLAILLQVPPCDPPLGGAKQAEFPVGIDWEIHEFDKLNLAWCKTERRKVETARAGMFRFQLRYQRPRHFLRRKQSTFELPRAVGLYTLLRRSRRDLLHYDVSARALRLPAICRPPLLLERALVLCSGAPAIYDAERASLTYAEVPPQIARFAAELLRQPLI
jgi:hypothetical protein